MSHTQQAMPARDQLTCWFLSGDALRSRSVSDVLLSGRLDVPAPPARLTGDWDRQAAMELEAGDVDVLPLARARMRWPDYKLCVQAVADWTHTLGFGHELLPSSELALMACRGARYHHDGAQYGGSVFCNLFLSEDKGLDLHFAFSDQRIPLVRGTVVVFDTCQPHAVIDRNSHGFDAADFPAGRDCLLVFLTWELPVEQAAVAAAFGIAFDLKDCAAPQPDAEQVLLNGAPVSVCPASGQRRPA